MSCMVFKGFGTGKTQIQHAFLFIFILIELVIFIITKNIVDFVFIIGQITVVLMFLVIYFIAIVFLRKEGEFNVDSYKVEICEDKIKMKSPFRNVTVLGEDIESIKLRWGAIYFRFKDFSKYAKEYDLDENQIRIMQKKKYYWVGNGLPAMSKEERKKFEIAINEFRGRFNIE